jgi:hypothetical protein
MGVRPEDPATSGPPGAAPDPSDFLDRGARRFSGSSAGVMIRAYVFVIPASHAAPSRFALKHRYLMLFA